MAFEHPASPVKRPWVNTEYDSASPVSPTYSLGSQQTATTCYTSSDQRSPITSPESSYTSNDDDEEDDGEEGDDERRFVRRCHKMPCYIPKTDKHLYRERGAKQRALDLIETVVAEDEDEQNAINRYQIKKKLDRMDKYAEDREKWGKQPLTVTEIGTGDELLAESSRKIKPKEWEGRAVEKCQIDIDREAWAKAKALRYLNQGFM